MPKLNSIYYDKETGKKYGLQKRKAIHKFSTQAKPIFNDRPGREKK